MPGVSPSACFVRRTIQRRRADRHFRARTILPTPVLLGSARGSASKPLSVDMVGARSACVPSSGTFCASQLLVGSEVQHLGPPAAQPRRTLLSGGRRTALPVIERAGGVSKPAVGDGLAPVGILSLWGAQEVRLHGRRLVDVHHALGPGLRPHTSGVVVATANRQTSSAMGDVVQVQAEHFAGAEAAVEHEQKHGPVTFTTQRGQQGVDLAVGQRPRQSHHRLYLGGSTEGLLPAGSFP